MFRVVGNYSSKRMCRWSAYLLLLLACLVVIGLTGNAIWTAYHAKQCIRKVAALVPGKSTLQDAQKLFRDGAFVGKPTGCTEQRCSIGFHFESLLTWWGLVGPPRFLQGYVELRNGVVETIDFYYSQRGPAPISVDEGPSKIDPARRGMPVGLSVGTFDAMRNRSVARVRDFATLPEDSRIELLQFNSWCLVRVGGCTDVRQVFPGTRALAFTN
jgi:hypothetical protein